MASKNVETVRAAHESWNRRDFDGVIRDMADNVSYNDTPRNLTVTGKQDFKGWCQLWAKAFPDGRITNAKYIDAGDVVVAEFIVEGTNTGPFNTMAPTNRRMTCHFCEVTHFDKQGRPASGNIYYDLYTMLTQLGHAEPLSAAA